MTRLYMLAAAISIPLLHAYADEPRSAETVFKTAEDVQITLCAKEPLVTQPVYLTFDERGRMWVVQYRQYPFPNGLNVVGHDMYWRVKYDNWPPPPPPQGAKGQDRVTILEDTDGDGNFESAKDFLSDLNIATAALPAEEGVWVMNPPYLLYYADADHDDQPDGDPVVHLAGFGLQDMHAVASSLMWGPDGWIYGCQGSTCTASITQPGVDKKPVDFSGQCIWRYEPNKKIFEVFAEGGYNNFGIAMDPAGRMFTGSNGGLIGVYYMQGGYYWKNWGKHGPHSKPYTYGYLPSMPDTSSRAKLSQGMAWYEHGALPDRYDNQLIVARVMQYRVDACALTPQGSNFAAKELGPIVSTDDARFRPVDVKIGPDGAVYIADWFDGNVTWQVSAEKSTTDRDTGRIYRIAKKGVAPFKPFNLTTQPTDQLVSTLLDGNPWQRQMALRLLRERRDPAAFGALSTALKQSTGPKVLAALWALFGTDALSTADLNALLTSRDPDLRRWAARLIADKADTPTTSLDALVAASGSETEGEVRSQLAASARRLPAKYALPALDALAAKEDSASDPFLPLLIWWGIDAKLSEAPDEVGAWLLANAHLDAAVYVQEVIPRLARRCMQERSATSLHLAAQLIERSHTPAFQSAVLSGMEQGMQGEPLKEVPDSLRKALDAKLRDRVPDGQLINVAMRLGVGDMAGVALDALRSGRLDATDRREVLRMLAEQRRAEALPLLVTLLKDGPSNDDRAAAIDGLQHFDTLEAADALVASVPQLDAANGDKALGVLVSRKESALKLLAAVDAEKIPAKRLALDVLATARGLNDDAVNALLVKHYGNVRKSPEELAQRVKEVRDALDTAAGVGDKLRGKVLFGETCAKCHILFNEGRKVGPELTGVERSNREQLIQSIVDPSAVVLPEFMATTFTLGDANDVLADNRQVTGFLLEENAQSLSIIDSAGNEITVPPAQVTKREPMEISLMPTGLLDALTPQQIRDLFAYLQASAP